MHMQTLFLAVVLGSASAFVASPVIRPMHAPAAAVSAPPTMLLDPVTTLDTTSLLALALPIPAYSPAKAFIMMFSNILVICTMSIQGKSLAGGTSHDEMVESFGLTWLLAGTSLGHIVGAGAILGCTAGGFL